MLILLRLVAPYVMPVAAPAVKIQLSSYPPATVIGLLFGSQIPAAWGVASPLLLLLAFGLMRLRELRT